MGSKQEKVIKDKNAPLATPKNFLVPIMLLLLRDFNVHGYELRKKMIQFGIETVDQGNFYRLLRKLEEDAMVTSEWDTSAGGPAKRIYSITKTGEQYLDLWANSLGEYQKMLNQFFTMYNPFFSPFSFGTRAENPEEEQE